ncbi:MAG: hypothetical protein CVV27_04705 [Candidatus Melainabacteria bacterium HGW-Melainabacteria-1]|nr:MAG: hypothetical protein CVV27_04705 [Candidatus Melainabacteria bacterium HGW-Melainabacteria-1]
MSERISAARFNKLKSWGYATIIDGQPFILSGSASGGTELVAVTVDEPPKRDARGRVQPKQLPNP